MPKKQWGATNSPNAASPKLPTFPQWLKANPGVEATEFQIMRIFRPATYKNWTICTSEFRCNLGENHPNYSLFEQAIANWSRAHIPTFIEVNYRTSSWSIFENDDFKCAWRIEPYGFACGAAFVPTTRDVEDSDKATDNAADIAAKAHRQKAK